MVKLDVTLLRYLTAEDIRVLTAVEMGMKNHELVPGSLVSSIAGIRGGGISKILQQLCRHKLLSYESGKRYDGYRLTYAGYDYLALTALRNRGAVAQVGNQIGVGKESDVFVALNGEDERVALKLHRLGRTCFRKVNDKRDYNNGAKVHSFLYMSRLAAKREFAFMEVLSERGFAVPKAISHNRHCVVMELVDGILLNNVTAEDVKDIPELYNSLMNMMLSLANECGVVHGDFNEFNLMYKPETNSVTLIDFPQMIGVDNKQAREYFERDVTCIVDFFKRKFNYVSDYTPEWVTGLEQNKDISVLEKLINVKLDDGFDVPNIDVPLHPNDKGSEGELTETEVVCQQSNQTAVDTKDVYSVKAESLERERLTSASDGVQRCSSPDGSTFQPSVAGSTFDPIDIRKKIRGEREKKEKRESLRKAAQKVKGEANVIQRHRKEHRILIKEDLKSHAQGDF